MSLRIISLLFLQVIAVYAFAQPGPEAAGAAAPPGAIQWYSFEKAVELHKSQPDKMLFIDVYTNWCGWCKRMDATTFTNPVIVKYMNEHFLPVKLNAERKDTVVFAGHTFVNQDPSKMRHPHELAVSLLQNKMSYPSFAILDEKFQLLTAVQGYQQAPALETILHFFGDKVYLTTKWEEYQSEYKSQSQQ